MNRLALPLLIIPLLLLAPAAVAEQPAGEPLVAAGWQNQCADCPPQGYGLGDRSLRLDTQGRPHVAFVRDYVYYSWFDGAAWRMEALAPAPAAKWDHLPPPSLALHALERAAPTSSPVVAYPR